MGIEWMVWRKRVGNRLGLEEGSRKPFTGAFPPQLAGVAGFLDSVWALWVWHRVLSFSV